MKYLFTLLIFGISAVSISQTCLEGDCENSFGMKEMPDGDYLGFFKDGVSDKLGAFKNLNGDTQYSYYVDGLIQGTSIHIKVDGSIIVANYDKGLLEGDMLILRANINNNEAFTYENDINISDRALSYKNNESSEKNCRGNCQEGFGMKLLENNNVSMGYWKSGRVNGLGLLYQADTQGQYYGNFLNNIPDGIGLYVMDDGSIYFGEWNYGSIDGLCILSEPLGTVTAGDHFNGSWRNVIYTSN
jgi:hypothetical protein